MAGRRSYESTRSLAVAAGAIADEDHSFGRVARQGVADSALYETNQLLITVEHFAEKCLPGRTLSVGEVVDGYQLGYQVVWVVRA